MYKLLLLNSAGSYSKALSANPTTLDSLQQKKVNGWSFELWYDFPVQVIEKTISFSEAEDRLCRLSSYNPWFPDFILATLCILRERLRLKVRTYYSHIWLQSCLFGTQLLLSEHWRFEGINNTWERWVYSPTWSAFELWKWDYKILK